MLDIQSQQGKDETLDGFVLASERYFRLPHDKLPTENIVLSMNIALLA